MQITFQNSAGSSIFYTLNLKNVPFRNCLISAFWDLSGRLPIYSRLWKSAQSCHWAIFPSSAANFRPPDRWNRKSQIILKLGRILKFKPQQCYKLITTLLQTENEGKLGFELWPRFADFARFFCAFALNLSLFDLRHYFLSVAAPAKQFLYHVH